MAKLAVIVPVYNVEDCLEWCLISLRAQTFEDIEILCVNDGATDSSREVLAHCAALDPRIVIIDKKNGGLSSARNAGLERVTSPYVCFLDSDDRFTVNACERIVSTFANTDAEVVTFGANPYPRSAGYPWLNDVLSPRDVEYDGFDPDILFKEKSRPFVWRTACRMDLLRETKLRFDETLPFGEDQIFDFGLYPRSRKTVFISDKLYDYRVSRNGSLMDRRKRDPHHMLLEHVDIVEHVFDDWASGDGSVFRGASGCERAGDLLRLYAPEMIAWTVELVLYDALRLRAEDWRDVATNMSRVIGAHWDTDEIAEMPVDAAAKRIVLAAMGDGGASASSRQWMMARYYIARYGKRSFLSTVKRHIFH